MGEVWLMGYFSQICVGLFHQDGRGGWNMRHLRRRGIPLRAFVFLWINNNVKINTYKHISVILYIHRIRPSVRPSDNVRHLLFSNRRASRISRTQNITGKFYIVVTSRARQVRLFERRHSRVGVSPSLHQWNGPSIRPTVLYQKLPIDL